VPVAAVIPAYNEAPTVGGVVEVARAAVLVDEVIVVDNASTDDTAARAAEAGARVVRCDERGKGQAMRAGVQATDAEVIVFLDADLIGLRPDHVDRLARHVLSGEAGMACGLFDRGRLLNPIFLHVLPILTGERALRREIFESLDEKDVRGYAVEAALNSFCEEFHNPVVAFVCDGMTHRPKEKKYPNPVAGFIAKILMLLTAFNEYIAFPLRHRWRRYRRRGAAVERPAA
jgi:glycosyltransferase involved in cell wall biosynthesis